MKNIIQWILHKEPFLFFIFSILNVYTIFLIDFYYSLDGPQHLYVANIIAELLKGNDEVARFVQINDLIVGYWTGTFLLTIFKLIMPAKIAVKLILIIYYIGISYSFRYLVKSIYRKPTLITFLIFPFSASFFIGLGYYNFSLAIAVLFLCLGYFLRIGYVYTWKNLIIMGLLLVLLFLSHAFVYAIAGLILMLYLVFTFFYQWQNSGKLAFAFRNFLKHLGFLALLSLPANILWINYVVSIRGITSFISVQHIPSTNLFESIYNISILSWFVTEPHIVLNYLIITILVFLMLYAIVKRVISMSSRSKNPTTSNGLIPSDFWFFVTGIMLILYFFYPDRLITGNISNRILLLFFLMFLVWVSSQKYHAVISILILLFIIPISILKWEIHMRFLPELGRRSVEVIKIAESMEPNSTYLAMNYSNIWTHDHFSKLPGIDKPLIITNAPQVAGQFVLKINTESNPPLYLGQKDRLSCKIYWSLKGNDSLPIRPIDYVVLIATHAMDDDPDHSIVLDELQKYYIRKDTLAEAKVHLYELRNRKQLIEEYNRAISNADGVLQGSGKLLKTYYREKYLECLESICVVDTINSP